MNPVQRFEIRERAKRLKLADANLLALAREAAQNHQLQSIEGLDKWQAHDLIANLDRIERDETERHFRRRDAELVGAR